MFEEYGFEEYEDIFCEPSEIKTVFQNAISDITNLFTDKVKSEISEAAEATKRLDELKQEIYIAQQELNGINAEIEEAQRRQENAEMYEIPQKYIKRFVEKATGNYAPGDTVFEIKNSRNQSTCPLCNGAKKITIFIGGMNKEVQCPDCKGYGYIVEYIPYIEQSKVTDVRLKLCFRSDRVSYWSTDSVYLNNSDYCTKPENIFPTEEAAEKALKAGVK